MSIKHQFGQNQVTLSQLRGMRLTLENQYREMKASGGELFAAADEIREINELERKINEVFRVAKLNSTNPDSKIPESHQKFNSIMSKARNEGDVWDWE